MSRSEQIAIELNVSKLEDRSLMAAGMFCQRYSN